MKALILAGGTGSRLRPFTHSIAKQLLPVANKPVLEHCIETVRDVGVTDVGIIVGDHADEIASVVGTGARFGVDITYIRQDEPLGLAHCILIAQDFLGDDDFVMYLGDNILADGIAEAAQAFRTARPDAHIMVVPVADPRSYGVAEVDEAGRVLRLVEKPAEPVSDLAVIGVYFFTPAVHDAVHAIKPSARGELEITDAMQHMVTTGRPVIAGVYGGYWKDTGKPEDLLECSRILLERLDTDLAGEIDDRTTVTGTVVIEAGAKVIGSTLIGPLVVGAGSVLTDCTVGPSVAIGRDCVLEGSTISDSIVLEGAGIRGIRALRGSIIGRRADLSVAAPTALRLLVGDHCYAEVGA